MITKSEFLEPYSELIDKEIENTSKNIDEQLAQHGCCVSRFAFDGSVPYAVARLVMETIAEKVTGAGWTYDHDNKVGSTIFDIRIY